MTAVIPFLLLVASSVPGFLLLRFANWRVARWLGWGLLPCLFALPWLAPADPIARFFVAIGVVLAGARWMETLCGHAPVWASRSVVSYATFYLSVAELVSAETQAQALQARRAGGSRLLRALLKALALTSCFALSTAYPELHAFWPSHTLWCLYAAYFAASGGADLHSGLVMCVTGKRALEVFRTPPLATSPRDFWSRRWNAMFRNSAHRLVFTPLGGAAHPVRAVLGVFVASAVVHEYLIVAALGSTQGHMLAFFALQGAATLLTGLRRTPWPIARGLDVLLHSGWLVLSTPVFFVPMEQIFAVQQWRLW